MAEVGGVYTHWGRGSCGAGVTMLVGGFMASALSSSGAGGVQYLCLSNNPVVDQQQSGNQGSADIYPVEYHDNSALAMLNALSNFDAVCAVCQSPARSWALTVSGQPECPPSFVLDYDGYLMAELASDAGRSEYICVDKARGQGRQRRRCG